MRSVLHRHRLGAAGAARCRTPNWRSTVDTSDEWIVERTGIRFRHIAGPGRDHRDAGHRRGRAALAAAGLAAHEIDLIVLATATPDQTFPATATKVQAMLGIDDCVAFDVAAVCSGFLYALQVADSMLRTGVAKRALVIGAETFSRILDWEDRDDLRAVRRRRRRDRARRRRTMPSDGAASSRPGSTPTARITSCSMSMAARRPPAPSASCG